MIKQLYLILNYDLVYERQMQSIKFRESVRSGKGLAKLTWVLKVFTNDLSRC